MANERFDTWLIEGDTPPVGFRSLGQTLVAGTVLTVIGVLVVWALFLLLASA